MTPQLIFPPELETCTAKDRQSPEPKRVTSHWAERAAKLLAHEIAFVPHESFRLSKDQVADSDGEQLSVAIKESRSPAAASKKLSDLNVHYQRICETPLLSPELEVACFRHYNRLKFQANAYRSKLNPNKIERTKVEAIEQLLAEATEIRNFIIQANCRLAMSIVKKYADSSTTFDELLGESLSNLMGAVEKFDFGRGFRFSTYATQSIHRRLFRILAQRQRQRSRFVNNSEEALKATLSGAESKSTKDSQEELFQLQRLLTHLEQRERMILEARYGLHTFGQKQTFLEIAKKLKISKERVRQLAERAILKLRSLADELNLEAT